jgi:hypothetical protein
MGTEEVAYARADFKTSNNIGKASTFYTRLIVVRAFARLNNYEKLNNHNKYG